MPGVWQRVGIVVAVVAVSVTLSAVIPPFQSPDEFDHVKRAAGLLSGQILVSTPPGSYPGLWVDDGLLTYMQAYDRLPFGRTTRVNMAMIYDSERFAWTGSTSFSVAAGVGYYPPFVYLPQAVGLLAGKTFGWTVARSYRLARLMVLLSTLAILFVAFKLFPTNFFTLSLLLLPTTWFQVSSASPDAVTMALAVLCVSLFMKSANRHSAISPWMSVILSTVVVILTTCRMNMGPLILLPLFLYFVRRERLHLYLTIGALALIALWTIAALSTTSVVRGGVQQPFLALTWHYLGHPLEFVKVLWATLSNGPVTQVYKQQFIGTLGWLEPRLPRWFYTMEIATLMIALVMSISRATLQDDIRERLMLVFVSLTGLVLLFALLLVSYTPHPATIVMGVQGRYFLIPLLVLSYSLHGNSRVLPTARAYIAYPAMAGSGLFALYVMTDALLQKYYVSPAFVVQ